MKSRWNWLTRVASHTVKEGTAALRGMICLLQCHLLQRGWHIRVPCANSLCSQGREMGHNSSDPKATILDSTCKASVREDRGLVCEGTLTAEGCWGLLMAHMNPTSHIQLSDQAVIPVTQGGSGVPPGTAKTMLVQNGYCPLPGDIVCEMSSWKYTRNSPEKRCLEKMNKWKLRCSKGRSEENQRAWKGFSKLHFHYYCYCHC